jgi:hypothetical protein
MHFRQFCFLLLALLTGNCQNDQSVPKASTPVTSPSAAISNPLPIGIELIPKEAKETVANVNSVHVWVDKGNLCLAGIISNMSPKWSRFWLEAKPVDQKGSSLALSGHAGVVLTPYSKAVPPSGRTSFFASWPVSSFSGLPQNFTFTTWSVEEKPGPILAIPETSSIQMSVPQQSGQNLKPEVAWQMTGPLVNPLNMVADHPCIEVLVYGKDDKLWFATVLDTKDQNMRQIFQWDKEGPMKPKETRQINLQVYSIGMADALKDMGIKKIDLLPFNARN